MTDDTTRDTTRDTTCAKCGEEPRAGKNRWGKACLSDQRRRLRADKAPEGIEPTVPTKADRVADLEGEVARLKRELAKRGAAPAPVAAPVAPLASPEAATRELSYGRDSYAKASLKKGLHGQVIEQGPNSTAFSEQGPVQIDPQEPECQAHARPFCRLTGCWQELRDIRLARMKAGVV